MGRMVRIGGDRRAYRLCIAVVAVLISAYAKSAALSLTSHLNKEMNVQHPLTNSTNLMFLHSKIDVILQLLVRI